MAQPPGYSRTKDFTSDYADQLDRAALNNEFDGAAQSINALRSNLALIQRDDGGLASGIVGRDAIAPDLLDQITQEVVAGIDDQVLRAEQAASDSANAASAAQGSASSAQGYAQTALQEAGSAQASAQSASASQAGAFASATNAANASADAQQFALDADASATAAGQFAAQADASQSAAADSAIIAVDAAAGAAASETAAAGSASAAGTSAQTATEAAATAEYYAEQAAIGAGLPIYQPNAIPTTDEGPIYVPDVGPMEWSGTMYVPASNGLAAPRLVEDYGYTSQDFNDVIDRLIPGAYSSASSWGNGPVPLATASYFMLRVTGRLGEQVTQEVYFGTPAGATRVFARTVVFVSGTPAFPTRWTEVYTQASIVGAVSQVSGAPTGAIVERGASATGEYTRFADGTQICRGIVQGTGSGSRAYAAQFVAGELLSYPVVTASLLGASNGTLALPTIVSANPLTHAEVAFRQASDGSVATSGRDAQYIAIGRWFL